MDGSLGPAGLAWLLPRGENTPLQVPAPTCALDMWTPRAPSTLRAARPGARLASRLHRHGAGKGQGCSRQAESSSDKSPPGRRCPPCAITRHLAKTAGAGDPQCSRHSGARLTAGKVQPCTWAPGRSPLSHGAPCPEPKLLCLWPVRDTSLSLVATSSGHLTVPASPLFAASPSASPPYHQFTPHLNLVPQGGGRGAGGQLGRGKWMVDGKGDGGQGTGDRGMGDGGWGTGDRGMGDGGWGTGDGGS